MIFKSVEDACKGFGKAAGVVIRKALSSPTVSPEESIRAYCLMCKQGSISEIKDCSDVVCPLRSNRPHQKTETQTKQETRV